MSLEAQQTSMRCKRNGVWVHCDQYKQWAYGPRMHGLQDSWWGPWVTVGAIIAGVVGAAWYLTPPPRVKMVRKYH